MRTFKAQVSITFTDETYESLCGAKVCDMTKHFAETLLRDAIEGHDDIVVTETTDGQEREMIEAGITKLAPRFEGEKGVTIRKLV